MLIVGRISNKFNALGDSHAEQIIRWHIPTFIECVTICAHPDPAGQAGAISVADQLKRRGTKAILQDFSL